VISVKVKIKKILFSPTVYTGPGSAGNFPFPEHQPGQFIAASRSALVTSSSERFMIGFIAAALSLHAASAARSIFVTPLPATQASPPKAANSTELLT
jgi:hypothetical protein